MDCKDLNHLPLDKMTAISQMTCSNAFSLMKISEFQIKFHWNVFPGSKWQYVSIGSDNGLVPSRWQAIIWTNVHQVHRQCIYAGLGRDELKMSSNWSRNSHYEINSRLTDWGMIWRPIWGGGYKANFLRSVIFRNFQFYHNTCYLFNITFIFDRCRRSSAAVAPVKYKCDSNNLRSNFLEDRKFCLQRI